MKHIPLRTIEASQTSAAIDYADAIRTVIRQPLDHTRGVSIEEMRLGIRILDRLDAASGDSLDLEDADYEHLLAKVKNMTWGMVDRHLLEFIDTVLAAGATSPASNGLVAVPPLSRV